MKNPLNTIVRSVRAFGRELARQSVAPTPAEPPVKPKLGLALGGGFARGLAHIGVLKVLEETGLRAKPVAKLADIKYVYSRKWSDNARVFKVVSFFLMKYQSGQIDDITKEMRHEVRRAYWMPLAQASSRLRYNGERQVAKKALAYLKSHPEEF